MPHTRCGTDACHFKFQCHISASILYKHMCEQQASKQKKNASKTTTKTTSWIVVLQQQHIRRTTCRLCACVCLMPVMLQVAALHTFNLPPSRLWEDVAATYKHAHMRQWVVGAQQRNCTMSVENLFINHRMTCVALRLFAAPHRHALATNAFLLLLLLHLFPNERTTDWRQKNNNNNNKNI